MNSPIKSHILNNLKNFSLNWKTLLLTVIFLLAACNFAGAVTIHGTVYSWETLEPLPKTEIIVNTTPEQHMIAEDGNYEINLSKGTYSLQAIYYHNGEPELYAQKNITITREGEYKIDLILFPSLSEIDPEEPEDLNFSVDDENVTGADESEAGDGEYNLLVLWGIIFCVVAVAAAYGFVRKRRGSREVGPTAEKEPEADRGFAAKELEESEEPVETVGEGELPEDLDQALSIIRKEGGRITQKNLRKKMGYSEAKMSLVIADLERRGIIEKVKKGRGNIIFLKDT